MVFLLQNCLLQSQAKKFGGNARRDMSGKHLFTPEAKEPDVHFVWGKDVVKKTV